MQAPAQHPACPPAGCPANQLDASQPDTRARWHPRAEAAAGYEKRLQEAGDALQAETDAKADAVDKGKAAADAAEELRGWLAAAQEGGAAHEKAAGEARDALAAATSELEALKEAAVRRPRARGPLCSARAASYTRAQGARQAASAMHEHAPTRTPPAHPTPPHPQAGLQRELDELRQDAEGAKGAADEEATSLKAKLVRGGATGADPFSRLCCRFSLRTLRISRVGSQAHASR